MAGERILLVDDEKLLLSLLRRHLERSGYAVVDAESAEAALETVAIRSEAGWEPDILIADETLPGEPGTSLAAALLARYPRLLCLLCSGYPLTLDGLPVEQRSRAAILQKPYMPAALEQAVRALLSSQPGSSS